MYYKTIKQFYLLFILLLCSLTQFAQDSLWTQKADLNYSRWHLSANYCNGKIYAIGGIENDNVVEEYDIDTNRWQTKTSMPSGRGFVGSGVVDSKIYIIGGAKLQQPEQKVVEMYDPVTNEWTTVDSMPNARFGIGSCVYDDKIYTFGGNNPAEQTVEAYDPAEGIWISDLADMPTARWEPECVLVDTQIYVIGGFLNPTSGQASDDVEVYDPGSNSWTIKASLPEKRGGGAVAYAKGKIYYFGGSPAYGSPRNNAWAYDLEIDQWYILPEMPFSWAMMPTCVVDSMIYLMAGSKVAWPHNDNFKGVYTYKPSDYITGTPYIPDNPVDIEKHNLTESYQIYPNPAINILHFEGNTSSKEISYKIFSAEGIMQKNGIAENGSVNITQLHDGIYFIILDDNNKRITQSFLKVSN
jgi:N-acetylneuraminic acid mutarotase